MLDIGKSRAASAAAAETRAKKQAAAQAEQVTQLRADIEVERMAVDQAEQEAKERPPKNAHELQIATEQAIERLESLVGGNEVALDYLRLLFQRVQFYLHDPELDQLSELAKLLVKEVNGEEVDLQKKRVTETLRQDIRSEINPILKRIREVVEEWGVVREEDIKAGKITLDESKARKEQVLEILRDDQKVIEFLKTGSVENQTTTSLFGFLEGLSSHEELTIRKLVVIDPLEPSEENKGYWRDRMIIQKKRTKEKEESYPELIARRSHVAARELEALMGEADKKGNDRLADACVALVRFLDIHRSRWETNPKRTLEDLSFTNMDAKESVEVLGAAEVLKQEDPEVYVKLLGIAEGRESEEAIRSEAFGNIFHIFITKALKDRLQASSGSQETGATLLNRYLDNLEKIDANQLPVSLMNAEQFAKRKKLLDKELKKDRKKRNQFLTIALLSTMAEAAAGKETLDFLEEISGVDEEKREQRQFELELEAIKKYVDEQSHKRSPRSFVRNMSDEHALLLYTALAASVAARGDLDGAKAMIYESPSTFLRGEGSVATKVLLFEKAALEFLPDNVICKNPEEVLRRTSGEEASTAAVEYVIDRMIASGNTEEAAKVFKTFGRRMRFDTPNEYSASYKETCETIYIALLKETLIDEAEAFLKKNGHYHLDGRRYRTDISREGKKERVKALVGAGLTDQLLEEIKAGRRTEQRSTSIEDLIDLLLEREDFEKAQEVIQIRMKEAYLPEQFELTQKILRSKLEAGEGVDEEMERLQQLFEKQKYGQAHTRLIHQKRPWTWHHPSPATVGLEIARVMIVQKEEGVEELLSEVVTLAREGFDSVQNINLYIEVLERFHAISDSDDVSEALETVREELTKGLIHEVELTNGRQRINYQDVVGLPDLMKRLVAIRELDIAQKVVKATITDRMEQDAKQFHESSGNKEIEVHKGINDRWQAFIDAATEAGEFRGAEAVVLRMIGEWRQWGAYEQIFTAMAEAGQGELAWTLLKTVGGIGPMSSATKYKRSMTALGIIERLSDEVYLGLVRKNPVEEHADIAQQISDRSVYSRYIAHRLFREMNARERQKKAITDSDRAQIFGALDNIQLINALVHTEAIEELLLRLEGNEEVKNIRKDLMKELDQYPGKKIDVLCKLAKASLWHDPSGKRAERYLKKAKQVFTNRYTSLPKEIVIAYAEIGRIDEAMKLVKEINSLSEYSFGKGKRHWAEQMKKHPTKPSEWNQDIAKSLSEWFSMKYAGGLPDLGQTKT